MSPVDQGVLTLCAGRLVSRVLWLVCGAVVGYGGSEHSARNADRPRSN